MVESLPSILKAMGLIPRNTHTHTHTHSQRPIDVIWEIKDIEDIKIQ
jgi:hypothetical protein